MAVTSRKYAHTVLQIAKLQVGVDLHYQMARYGRKDKTPIATGIDKESPPKEERKEKGKGKKKKCSIALELALEPVAIKPVFPERASCLVRCRVVALFPLGGGTVHPAAKADGVGLHHSRVAGLRMRPAAERAARTL